MARKRYSVERIVTAVKAHENGTFILSPSQYAGLKAASPARFALGMF